MPCRCIFFILRVAICFSVSLAQASDRIDSLLEKASAIQYDQKEESLALVKQALSLGIATDDPLLLARIHNQAGRVHYISGGYNKALEHFAVAKNFGDQANAIKESLYATNGRALIQMVDKEYEEAIQLLKECLEGNTSLGDSLGVAKNLFNLGIAYDELGDLKLSMDHLERAMVFLEADRKSVLNLMVKNRMARVYHERGVLDRAEELYLEVLYDDLLLTNWEKSFALTGLAAIHFDKGDIEYALELGKQALEIAESHGAHWDLQQITGLLSRIYSELAIFDKAFFHLQAHKAYSDSLYDAAKNRQMARLQLNLTQTDNQRLRAEKERDNTLIQQHYKLMGFLVVLVVLLAGMLYFFAKHLRLKEHFNRSLEKKNNAIRQQKDLITQQNQSLKELNHVRTRLLSIISHDLRSPINAIKQLLEMKGKGYFSEKEEQDVFALLSGQVQNTEGLLNDLLEWANTQMDGMDAKPTGVDVTEMVDRVLEHLNFQVRTKFLEIRHQGASGLPGLALVDKNHLKIIIQNLIGNAIKFTPEYGRISIFYEEDERFVYCHIKDSGVGIDEVHQNLINGEDEGRIPSMVGTANEKGTGLGLLLVKQFLTLNGGRMDVQSLSGLGTQFTLQLKKA
ncbi:tetratricopeptide repeat-containing sensor histidine kinase [Cyclobacterium sp.]|uniref:tetratricopeptide repeat-containing sensor histidine kinase n=1 Tax=Cyclobacterium sp. TaxID=1966343 RepID=UPI00199F21CC|nr:tetratricopeptide repeat-containing sensor histidine kinase [Cyclobacterium sp.]MBD3627188.1 tetratricopeptide repeat protein [Cyclobacterium sp.]